MKQDIRQRGVIQDEQYMNGQDLLGYDGVSGDGQDGLVDGVAVDAEALSSNGDGDSDQDSDDNNYEVCFVV